MVVDVTQLIEIGRPGIEGLADGNARPGKLGLWLRTLGAAIADADRRLLTAIVAFVAMDVLGTVVFVEYKGLELVPAIYYVLTTMSTTATATSTCSRTRTG